MAYYLRIYQPMKDIKTTIKLALLGTALTALGAMTSCCGSSPEPDPISPPPVVIDPIK
ncbi:hypothetical protein N9Y81_03690 [Akkermansiaceae bacterium]|jgi:hypothetical protein|nr:hypothetical protein [Akkermansiaceae bacterium]